MYKYKAKVLDVYDADTCTLLIDVGFNIHIEEKVRLIGIDTPEIRTKNPSEKTLALEARDWVRNLILGREVEIKTHKKGKYGRYLAEILTDIPNITINKLLVEKGYARKYDGGKREPW